VWLILLLRFSGVKRLASFKRRLFSGAGDAIRTLANIALTNEVRRLCLKSKELYLEEVSTTCGSGWVNDEHAIFL